MGLSLGRPEADEMSRLEGWLGLRDRSVTPSSGPKAIVGQLTELDRRPLSACDAQVLLTIAEVAVTRMIGLPQMTPAGRFLDIPGLGRTAIRILLHNPVLGHVLRMEASGLSEAESYLLCEANAAQPELVRLLGWAGRQDVLDSPKVRLAAGEPEACAVSISGSSQ
jgi:hypothetical protein